MKLSLRAYLILTLIAVSLFASWQGIGATYAATKNYGYIGISSLCEPVATYPVAGSAPDGGPVLSSDAVLVPADPISNDAVPDSQWALEQIHALPSIRTPANGPPVLVAVLDTGIERSHEDLAGRVVAEINLTESRTTSDAYGHGTPVAGIIAADAENDLGMMGLAPGSRLVNVKVADDSGRCR